MQSTLNPKPSDDPHDVIVVAPDAVRVAPSDEQISHLLQQAARFHSEAQARNETGLTAGPPVPPVDTTFRAAAVNDVRGSGNGPSIDRRVGRPFAALLLALCIGAAAIGWQTFGYAAKKMMVKWVPQFALTTSLPLEKFWPSAQPAPPAVEADAEDAAPAPTAPSAQITPPPQTAAEGSAATATAPAADPAQSLQSMARDLASVSQEVVLLKASIAELKAQQAAREAAKTAEQNKVADQNARARIAALPPRPAVPRPHKPIAPYPPTQAYLPAQAYPPAAAPPVSQAATPYYPPRQPEPSPPAVDQLPPAPGFTSVPRPPMPVQ
jgi:hypothetical protein